MTSMKRDIEAIFNAARALSTPAERNAFLSGACGGDQALRNRLDALLAADAHAESFLAEPERVARGVTDRAADPQASTLNGHRHEPSEPPDAGARRPPRSDDDAVGSIIGSYKLLQVIGQGGFGTVYMAEQQSPVVRKVALKIIKLGMDTREVVARFEAERQALALMDHPSIARVFDAGATESGRPFFVMELVRGISITRFSDENRLSVRERLLLFMQVCRAVQHAHTKGIIHRDIKPGNVLVTMHDDRPVPKVIDFGIAKATQQRLTNKTLFTQFEQFIGTPAYMSPEQAQMSGLDVDTRSDIYALGVLLYELLTGSTPFDSKKLLSAGYDELRRVIREDDPPKPSTRVGSSLRVPFVRSHERESRPASGTSSCFSLADLRRTDPRTLIRSIRGELDWMVMKALEKDRTRRYETANGFALDVERYLAGEPIAAAPAGTGYRARKFILRHRAAVTTVIVVAASLVFGLAAATVGFVQARQQRNVAQRAYASEQEQRQIAEQERERARDYAEELRQALYISQIGRAQHLIETGGNDPLKPILEECDAELRGWEWERLNWLADRSDHTLHTQLTGSSYGASSIAYSSDGRRFLTIGDGGHVRIWDAEAFQMVQELIDPDGGEVLTAALSSDGAILATGTDQSAVRVFDASTGRLRATYKADGPPVRGVAISPDNALLAAGAWFGPTRIWDARSGALVRELPYPMDRGEALHFSADGSRLLVGSLGNDVTVVDVATGKPIISERGAGFVVFDAALSRDETKIASVGQDSRLWVRDARTGQLCYAVSGSKGSLYCVAFHPDGDYLAVGSDDGILFFDATNGEKLGSLSGHDAGITGLSFHPLGRQLLSIDARGVVKRWHLGVRQAVTTFSGTMSMNAVAFSADAATIYLGTTDEGLRAIDARTLDQLNPGPQPIVLVGVGGIVVSPDGSSVAAWGASKVFGVPGGENVAVLFDRQGRARHHWPCPTDGLLFSPDSRLMATREREGFLVFRDVRTAQIIRECPLPADVRVLIAAGDSSSVLTGHGDGAVRTVDLETGSVRQVLDAHAKPVRFLLLTPTREALVTGSLEEDTIRVWDWPSGRLRHRFDNAGVPQSAAVSPDGRRLVAGGNSLIVPLWDLHTGRRIMSIGQHSAAILSVAFSPDGATIASCGYDHALRIWETRMPSATALEKRHQRDLERWAVRRELILELGDRQDR